MSVADSWQSGRADHWLTAAWSQGFCRALALTAPGGAGGALVVESRDPDPAAWAAWEQPIWVLFPADADEPAGLYVGCSAAVMRRLGRLALGDAKDEPGRLAAETYREIISQACAAAAEAVRDNLASEVRFAGGVDADPPPEPSLAVELWFELDGAKDCIAVAPDDGFLHSFLGEPSEQAPGEEPVGAPEPDQPADLPGRNLEMLLDLDMEIAVSFGQTQMLLNDVLKLSVGSIVELDCQASDPVEVLVNNTVIARGEVVVVDNNYGVRITDVSSRKERIRSIF